jgi:glycosyltransferase involved in cell wall biosynthesis
VLKHNHCIDSQQWVGSVLIVTPGGLEHGGGIGRQMGYFLRSLRARPKGLSYRVVDSRGPWFIGASPFYIFAAVIYLGYAVLTLFLARCFLRACLLHVNITGRGSTIRKVVLLTVARVLRLRYILHLHDYDYADYYKGRGPYLKRLIATAFLHAATVVVLGRRDREVISQLFKLPTDRVVILHNAVADPAPVIARVHHPGEPCHVLFLGYLSARKGVPELLRALASLPATTRRWRATLAGGGPIDEFRKLADNRRLPMPLARVINDDNLGERLGRGGRERFLAEFDVPRYASRLTSLHARLLRHEGAKPEPIVEGQIP